MVCCWAIQKHCWYRVKDRFLYCWYHEFYGQYYYYYYNRLYSRCNPVYCDCDTFCTTAKEETIYNYRFVILSIVTTYFPSIVPVSVLLISYYINMIISIMYCTLISKNRKNYPNQNRTFYILLFNNITFYRLARDQCPGTGKPQNRTVASAVLPSLPRNETRTKSIYMRLIINFCALSIVSIDRPRAVIMT